LQPATNASAVRIGIDLIIVIFTSARLRQDRMEFFDASQILREKISRLIQAALGLTQEAILLVAQFPNIPFGLEQPTASR
jgi:hypothetical protein